MFYQTLVWMNANGLCKLKQFLATNSDLALTQAQTKQRQRKLAPWVQNVVSPNFGRFKRERKLSPDQLLNNANASTAGVSITANTSASIAWILRSCEQLPMQGRNSRNHISNKRGIRFQSRFTKRGTAQLSAIDCKNYQENAKYSWESYAKDSSSGSNWPLIKFAVSNQSGSQMAKVFNDTFSNITNKLQ